MTVRPHSARDTLNEVDAALRTAGAAERHTAGVRRHNDGAVVDAADVALQAVDVALLRRYDRPGPRYTSYPTAPVWTDAYGPADYREHLARAGRQAPAAPLSLYVHIPFCRDRCTFCACNVVVTEHREKADPYLDAVETEIAMVADLLADRRDVIQLHWGGGTPTFLDLEQIARLHGAITRHFRVLDDAEVSIEVDPGVTTYEQLSLLAELGFNRLSIGVQDFSEAVLAAVNRPQTVNEVRSMTAWARALGFGGINYDLIYGLPHQTRESFAESRKKVLKLRPDRLAVYSYAHVPWIKGHQTRIDEAALPGVETKFALYLDTIRDFLGAGYEQIGMDHFALPEDELAVARHARRLHRNFMGYTTRPAPDMVAFGVSAISNVIESFAQNTPVLKKYEETLARGELATARGYRLDADDRLRADVIRNLMCHFEVDFAAVRERHGVRFHDYFARELIELEQTIDPDFYQVTPDRLALRPVGRLFVRNLCMVFDGHIDRSSPKRRVFSRTV